MNDFNIVISIKVIRWVHAPSILLFLSLKKKSNYYVYYFIILEVCIPCGNRGC